MNIASLVKVKPNPKIPDITPGETVRVSSKIVEGGKERIQVFQGVVIRVRRGGAGASFTVRHVAYGIGVERTFPLYSPLVEKVEIVRQGKVRRAKLYYLRGLSGKAARKKIKRVEGKKKEILEAALEPEEVQEEAQEEVLKEEQVREEEPAAAPVLAQESIQEGPALKEEPEPKAVLEQETKAGLEEKPEEVREGEPEVEKVLEQEKDQKQENETP